MKAQHTPGPWTCHKLDSGLIAINNDQREEHVVQTVYDTHEQEANARLIAAAPDLLEALMSLINCPDLNLQELDDVTITACDNARAAITKATA